MEVAGTARTGLVSRSGGAGRGNPDFSLNVGLIAGTSACGVGLWFSNGSNGSRETWRDAMFWKIVGALIVAWVAFMVIGSVVGFLFKAVLVIAVIGGIGFLGAAAYGAIKNKNRKQIR
jgi:hypothetical protein